MLTGFGSGSFELPAVWLNNPSDPAGRHAPNDKPLNKGGVLDSEDNLIVKRIREVYEYERRARMPHEVVWDRAVARVNNEYSFKKQPWQSQKALPAMAILAFKFAWELTKQLQMAGKAWFKPEAQDTSWEDYGLYVRDFVASFLDTGGEAPEDNFRTTFYDMIFMGLQMQNCHALVLTANDGVVDTVPDADTVFEPGEEPIVSSKIPPTGFGSVSEAVPEDKAPPLPGQQPFRLRIEAFNPRNIYLDSSNSRNGTYKVWYQDLKPGQFRAEGMKRGWNNIDEVIAASRNPSQTAPEKGKQNRDKQEAVDTRLDTIRLFHYWGTLYDSDGEVVFEDKYCIMSSDMIVYGPVENPCWHGQIPIISCGLLRKPKTTYHDSILTLNIDPQDALVEIVNAVFDQIQWAINPPTEIDWDQLHSQRQNQIGSKGVFPGMNLHLQKGGRNYPAMSRMNIQGPGSDTWQAVGMAKQICSEYTAMADTAAMPRTRNRISAEEFKERAAASTGIMEQICDNIQSSLLEPILYQAYLLLLQKCPQQLWTSFFEEKAKQYEGQVGFDPIRVDRLRQMAAWGPRDRYSKLGAVFRFKVDVFSASESKRGMLEKLGMFVEAASKAPPLLQRINFDYVGEEWARLLDLDPGKVMLPSQHPGNPPEGSGQEVAIPGTPNPVGMVTPPPGIPR